MNEATVDIVVILLGIAAIAVVLFDRFAGRVLAADPEHEDWPT